MRKKILLIKAAYRKQKVKSLTQPLGIMYISSFIKKVSRDFDIRLFDNRFFSDNSRVEKVIREYDADIVGISSITQEAQNMHDIADIVKRHNRNTVVIAGGPHPTQFFEDVLMDRNIDFVIRGEGEEAFFELVEKIKKDENIGLLNGVAYRRGEEIIDGGRAILRMDINELPLPDYESIDMEDYFRYFSMATIGKRRYAAISTSRGCPYECIYCHNLFGRRFRYMSPERVITEIDYLVRRYKVTDIEFVEDIFNLNRERAEKILDMLIERNYKLKLAFPNGLRSDMLDRGLLEKFRKAGTIFISFAIETGSFEQQKNIKKRLDLEKARKAIDMAVDMGILCNGFFMLGFPNETKEEIKRTIDFALNSRLHTAYFFIVNPFKGTELYNVNRERIDAVAISDKYDEYSYFLGRFNLSEVPTQELLKMQRNAYIGFYLNPKRLIRLLRIYMNIPSGIKFLLYYGLKTLYLIGDRAVKGILHYEDSFDKTQNAS